MVAPCPHDGGCPMEGTKSWCHFSQRFQRSQLQRQHKVRCILFTTGCSFHQHDVSDKATLIHLTSLSQSRSAHHVALVVALLSFWVTRPKLPMVLLQEKQLSEPSGQYCWCQATWQTGISELTERPWGAGIARRSWGKDLSG